jgi:Mrp family chromosome partitioning ATPase
MLHELREQFDYIVVDTPPVLPVADALLVGQYVDGVIFALLRGTSRLPRVYAAYQKMTNLGLHVIGGVLNAARSENLGYDMEYNNPKSLEEIAFSTDSLADIDLSLAEKTK